MPRTGWRKSRTRARRSRGRGVYWRPIAERWLIAGCGVVKVLRLSFLTALPLPVVPIAVVAIVPVVSVITTPTATRCRGARSWDACCRCAGSRRTRSRSTGGGRGDCRRDVAVSRVDAGAKRPQSCDGPERYARQEQCVLNEVLRCVIRDETPKEVFGHRF
jgi:hypothetical protein